MTILEEGVTQVSYPNWCISGMWKVSGHGDIY